ncbi:MAG: efflux RND transporter permease subunit, partial [candidate division Zixibacteria bacterium]|nr:efflux RND transporter permease subunit [candidate division Zixibacteria bacterium]
MGRFFCAVDPDVFSAKSPDDHYHDVCHAPFHLDFFSLVVVYFIGWTLNIFVMMGLMISVGMVVDNGIVVLENIYHKRNEGVSARKASIWGASEVGLAIIMATLTSIAVFVPMLLMEDGGGGLTFYLQRIGLPVIFSLAASLFVALVMIPLATTKLAGGQVARENKLITHSKAYYQKSLQFALSHRLDVVLIVVGILGLMMILSQHIAQSDSMEGNISDIRLMFDLPNHFSEEEAFNFFKEVEDTVNVKSEEYGVKAIDTGFRQGFGRVRVYLEPPQKQQWYHVIYGSICNLLGIERDLRMTREEVLADLKKRVPKKPGVEFRTSWRGGQSEEGTVSIMLYGDDTNKLAELAEELERRMRLIDGVVSVETDRQSGNDEIKISMNREVVTRNGINPNQVAYTLMYAVRGLDLPRFQAEDKEIEMRIQLQEEDRENLNQLKNMTFTSVSGA